MRKLAALLAPYLKKTDSVCDAGVRPGYLAALAPLVGHVTAAEWDDRALDVLRRQLARRHIRNVTPLCTDVLAYTPSEPFDAMVFCFFRQHGGDRRRRPPPVPGNGAGHCPGRHVPPVFRRAREPGRHSFESACGYLERQGIPYTSRRMALDFPQPLRTQEDARRLWRCTAGGTRRKRCPHHLFPPAIRNFRGSCPVSGALE